MCFERSKLQQSHESDIKMIKIWIIDNFKIQVIFIEELESIVIFIHFDKILRINSEWLFRILSFSKWVFDILKKMQLSDRTFYKYIWLIIYGLKMNYRWR